jgi:hypothetical protein
MVGTVHGIDRKEPVPLRQPLHFVSKQTWQPIGGNRADVFKRAVFLLSSKRNVPVVASVNQINQRCVWLAWLYKLCLTWGLAQEQTPIGLT